MANLIYDSFFNKLMDGAIDLNTDTIKCALLTSSYIPSAAHILFSEVNSNEMEQILLPIPNGYTTGGNALSGVTITGKKFDANNVSWANSTITARYAVIYKPANGALICLLDFGSNRVTSNQTFTVEFNTNGIITFAQSA